jgi:hypothetical protein
MPGGDRTGPMGAGPKTGRAAGFCAGYDTPGYMNISPGRGGRFGRGRGGGLGRTYGWGRNRVGGDARGWRWRGVSSTVATADSGVPDQPDAQPLEEALNRIQEELSDIRRRLNKLESV